MSPAVWRRTWIGWWSLAAIATVFGATLITATQMWSVDRFG